MVLDLSKFEPVNNLRFDMTVDQATIYFLIYVDEKTPRYKRVDGEYHLHPQGKYVFDFYDVLERQPRVLKYVGESSAPQRRIYDHYHTKTRTQSQVGPVFNYVRRFKFKKRFSYDNVRVTEESRLVQKFIPELNKNSRFNDKYKAIMLNSEGKIKPQDLIAPFVMHARDVYQAFQAWEKEDQNYIDTVLVPPEEGCEKDITKKQPVSYRDPRGKKKTFGRFFGDNVLRRHKKQSEAMTQYAKNMKVWTELYAPEFHEEKRRKAAEAWQKYKITYKRKNHGKKKQDSQGTLAG